MSEVSRLKQRYNVVLVRIKNGEVFMDDSDIPLPERELQIPSFIKLTHQAGAVLRELQKLGISYTRQEFEGGFITSVSQ